VCLKSESASSSFLLKCSLCAFIYTTMMNRWLQLEFKYLLLKKVVVVLTITIVITIHHYHVWKIIFTPASVFRFWLLFLTEFSYCFCFISFHLVFEMADSFLWLYLLSSSSCINTLYFLDFLLQVTFFKYFCINTQGV